MSDNIKIRYEARAAVLKALGHPSRLFIVDELAKGERCVNELAALVGADMSTISKHLSILKSAGLVNDEKRGNSIFYRLAIPCIVNFFSCVESVVKAKAQAGLDSL
ncbi:MAG: winged helix-turn-helix transcriptional regulator [Calditrichaeota bacterium]|nr:winged helix-turn-helix transcriptional regulator [Calditrichota bacterium]